MQRVELHRELETVFRGEKGLEVEGAELVERRLLHGLDEAGHVERQTRPPGAFENIGEQDVFARTDGVRFDAEQTEQARDDRAHAVTQRTLGGRAAQRGLSPSDPTGGENERSTDSGNPVSAPGV